MSGIIEVVGCHKKSCQNSYRMELWTIQQYYKIKQHGLYCTARKLHIIDYQGLNKITCIALLVILNSKQHSLNMISCTTKDIIQQFIKGAEYGRHLTHYRYSNTDACYHFQTNIKVLLTFLF